MRDRKATWAGRRKNRPSEILISALAELLPQLLYFGTDWTVRLGFHDG
jgi:hypothetical protein